MIRRVTDSEEARLFLNSVPFDEYVPDGFPVCNAMTIVLGWWENGWKAMFPCTIEDDSISMHACIDSGIRGKKAVKIGKAAIRWIFENTDYTKVVVYPKIKHGSVYAYLCGMRRNGKRFEVEKWAVL